MSPFLPFSEKMTKRSCKFKICEFPKTFLLYESSHLDPERGVALKNQARSRESGRGARAPPEIFRLELNSATKIDWSLTIQYNTIKILLSTPHGGFSETNINSIGNQNKQTNKKYSRIVDKQLLRNNYYETICI